MKEYEHFVRIDHALNHMHKNLQSVRKMAEKKVLFTFLEYERVRRIERKRSVEMMACLSQKFQTKNRQMHFYSIRKTFSHLEVYAVKKERFDVRTMNQAKIHKLEYNCRCLCIQIGLQ